MLSQLLGLHPFTSPSFACSGDKYKQSQRTSAGAHKWLDVGVWGSTAECVKAVKVGSRGEGLGLVTEMLPALL